MSKLKNNPVVIDTFVAAADFPKYTLVKIDSSGKAARCGANEAAIGVAMSDASANKELAVVRLGLYPVIAGSATLAAGDYLVSDANGKAVKAGTTAGTTYNIAGVADGASSAIDELIPAYVSPARDTV